MKHFIFPILACTIAVAYSNSYGQKVMLGARGGINIGRVAWDSAAPSFLSKSSSIGVIGGLQLDVWLNNTVAVSTGLLYDQKGWHYDYGNPTTWETYDYILRYAELPITLKVAYDVGSLQPFVFGGTSVGFLVAGHVTASGEDNYAFRVKESFNTFDLSILGGVGVALNLSSGVQVYAQSGYAYGVLNILKDPTTVDLNQQYGELIVPYWRTPPGVGGFRTRDIRVDAGLLFPL